jgi:ADP-ribose pyrophosphatase YjhB (NUDIX family)
MGGIPPKSETKAKPRDRQSERQPRPMPMNEQMRWLEWSRRLQSLAQNGLTYCKDPYDEQRYNELRTIAAEIMAAGAGLPESASVLERFKFEEGYATPKIDIRAAVFKDEKILLVKERSDGLWTLPGGWADVGESPSLAAVREVKEESGFDVAVKKLAAVYDRDKHNQPPIQHHVYKIFFLCELRGGAAAESVETSGVDFFSEGKLPPLSLTRVTEPQINHMFEHHRNPALPTSFD